MLPFKIRPPLTQSPLIKSGYAHPVKSNSLKEALLDLLSKLVVEEVVVRSSLAFYNRLFLVPKPNNKWKPILDLGQLNLYLQPGTFKMETPVVPPNRRMGKFAGFQRRLFPHSHQSEISKVPQARKLAYYIPRPLLALGSELGWVVNMRNRN